MASVAEIEAAHALLADLSETEAMATELVAKVDRAIALAEACADHAPENNAIINAGREALREIADFFGVDVPGLVPQGEGRSTIDIAIEQGRNL